MRSHLFDDNQLYSTQLAQGGQAAPATAPQRRNLTQRNTDLLAHDPQATFWRDPQKTQPREPQSSFWTDPTRPAAPKVEPPPGPQFEGSASPPELIRNLTSAAQQAADRFRNDRVAQAGWRTMWGQPEPAKKTNEPRYTLSPSEMRAAGIHRVVKNGSSYSSDPFAKEGDGTEVRYYSSGSQRLDRHLPAGVPKLSDTADAVRAYDAAQNKAPRRTAEEMLQLAYHDLNRYGSPEQRHFAAQMQQQAAQAKRAAEIKAGAPLTDEEKMQNAAREIAINRAMTERNKAYVDLEKSRAEAAIAQQGNFANNATAAFERQKPVMGFMETLKVAKPDISEKDALIEAMRWAANNGIDPRGLPMFEALEAGMMRGVQRNMQRSARYYHGAVGLFDDTHIPVPTPDKIKPRQLTGWERFKKYYAHSIGGTIPAYLFGDVTPWGARGAVDYDLGDGRTLTSFLTQEEMDELSQLDETYKAAERAVKRPEK